MRTELSRLQIDSHSDLKSQPGKSCSPSPLTPHNHLQDTDDQPFEDPGITTFQAYLPLLTKTPDESTKTQTPDTDLHILADHMAIENYQ